MKIIYILCFALIYCTCCNAQFNKSTYLRKQFTTKINENGDILHATLNAESQRIISRFDTAGELVWSKRIFAYGEKGSKENVRFFLNDYITNDASFLIPNVYNSARSISSLIKIDPSGQAAYSKLYQYPQFFTPLFGIGNLNIPKIIDFSSKETLLLNYLSSPLDTASYYSFIKSNENGEIVWHKEFRDELPKVPILFLNKLESDRFALIRNGTFLFDNSNTFLGNLVQILDKEFNELKTILIDSRLRKIIFKNNRYYILSDVYKNREEDQTISNTNLICLDANFKVLWAKYYDNLDLGFTFFETSYGFMISKYVADNNIDLVAIDLEGEVIESIIIPSSYNIFAAHSSKTHFVHEGNFRDEDGELVRQIRCSSNKLDNFECYIPTNCITAIDFEAKITEVADFYLSPINVDITVTDADLETVDYVPDYEDYCNEDFGNFPIPLFDLPDTICISAPQDIMNLRNEFAEEVLWSMPGSTIESSTILFPGPLLYSEAGVFTITQEVTFEGCTNQYSKDIVVVSPVEINVSPTIILCDQDPHLINISNEDAISYLWEDGSTESSLLTNGEGSFSAEVTDKHCIQSIGFNVTYFDFDEIESSLGNDTIICLQKPLILGSEINPNSTIIWNDQSTEYPRIIIETGNYELTTSLDGCSTSSSIFIEIEDCATQLYIPTVFSPNRDGFNDSFYPLGNFFEVLDFSIFDRWGSLVHSENDAWDGTYREKESPLGVYTYKIQLKNTRLDKVENHSGTFLLMR